MPTCPRCKTICEPSAEKCDCGYEIQLPADMQASEMRRHPDRRNLGTQAAGAALIGIGIVGWVTYNSPLGEGLSLLAIWIGPGCLLVGIIGLILLFFGTVARK